MHCTQRETSVLKLLITGKNNKQIAKELSISPHTVRDHISAMLQRFGLCNRVHLAAHAFRSGWHLQDSWIDCTRCADDVITTCHPEHDSLPPLQMNALHV